MKTLNRFFIAYGILMLLCFVYLGFYQLLEGQYLLAFFNVLAALINAFTLRKLLK